MDNSTNYNLIGDDIINSKQAFYEKSKKIIDKINEIDLRIETYSKFKDYETAKKLKAKKNELELMLHRLKGGPV